MFLLCGGAFKRLTCLAAFGEEKEKRWKKPVRFLAE